MKRLYVVRDIVAEECGPIFEAKNDGIAFRQFQNLLEKSEVRQANDYQCLCLGTMDHETMLIDVYPVPQMVSIRLSMVDEVDDDAQTV